MVLRFMFDANSSNNRIYSKRSLHGMLAHEIGLRIITGRYPPDSNLPNEEAFSAELNVSRTAYREAIKVLTAKCLITSRPKTGTRVRPRNEWNMLDPDLLSWQFEAGPDLDFVRSLFDMRIIFEPQAAARAAELSEPADHATITEAMLRMATTDPNTQDNVQADLDFHQAILAATHNELIIGLGHLINSALLQSFKLSTHTRDARAGSVPLHQSVHDAIIENNPDRARESMDILVRSAWKDIEMVMRTMDSATADNQ